MNIWKIKNKLKNSFDLYKGGKISSRDIIKALESWSSYAIHGNTYRLRQISSNKIEEELNPLCG